MNGRIKRSKAPEVMVSRRPPNPVRKGHPAQIPALLSPLEKTPHKTRIERDDAMSAARALIEMTAEHGGTTPRDSQ
jgi:hypothetical protein